ncbi:uncharacterized protein LOC142628592 [Castanea sativa]|uniref:uncharacterized protein LOC142628592 n=1 Tax=Castanea sativa TaxID=21020 RepID=UPI003F64E596
MGCFDAHLIWRVSHRIETEVRLWTQSLDIDKQGSQDALPTGRVVSQIQDPKLSESRDLPAHIVQRVKTILDRENPFVKEFRQLAQMEDLHQCKLIIKEQHPNQPQYCLPTASQVAAVAVGGDEAGQLYGRNILVETIYGQPITIPDVAGYYDPLQYPLLFPFGTYGWDINTTCANNNTVTCREFYAYRFQIRLRPISTLLHEGRLLQQYGVDMHVKIESHKLRWIQQNQEALWAEQYQGLQDAFQAGENYTGNVGHRTILPSSFVRSPRDMIQRFQDAMNLVQKFGKPNLFITMTCNPGWEEIRNELLPGQTSTQTYDTWSLWNTKSKITLHENGKCKKSYSNPFSRETYQGNDSYPVYRRRDTNNPVPLNNQRNVMVDNSWVVPYNPWLLLKYNCHINLEICSSIKSVKYLYNYVYKGPDRISVEVRLDPNYDEVQQYVDARWICAPEAFWKTFSFSMYRMYPSVERLQIHLQNQHQVRFRRQQPIENILEQNKKTMLTEFFTMNTIDANARQYLYREFPEHYCWNRNSKSWRRRISHKKVIGRIYTISPLEGERFYLRVILNHVKGPTGFQDLLTVNGITYPTFKQAAEQRGLLENDNSIRQCMLEAVNIRMPSALRRLFATILVFCEPTRVRDLWNEFYLHMVENYPSLSITTDVVCTNRLLNDLKLLLSQHGRRITEFDLLTITATSDESSSMPRIIQDELTIPMDDEELILVDKLNNDKKFAYNTIMEVIQPTSGIAAILLLGGRTAHSRFKIPLILEASSTCSISKQSDLAELIRRAVVLIWDEAPMVNRRALEALDRTLQDLMEINSPFGGKVLILGGDFRQLLPVIPKGTKAKLLDACIVNSPLWRYIKILHLTQNMRSINDQQFLEYIRRIGDGIEPFATDDLIKVPSSMAIPWEGDHSIAQLIEQVFPDLQNHAYNARYMVDRALLTPINEDVDKLNEKI